MCSVCSVHSLTGFAEVLCTETCSLSLQIGISFEFIEFPWLKHLQICQQGLLQQSICYQIVSRIFWGFWSPSCPCIYQSHVPSFKMSLNLHFPLSSQLLICPTAGRALLAAPCASWVCSYLLLLGKPSHLLHQAPQNLCTFWDRVRSPLLCSRPLQPLGRAVLWLLPSSPGLPPGTAPPALNPVERILA